MQAYAHDSEVQTPRKVGHFRSVPVATAALFLDLDGTLAAFESEPNLVVPNPDRSDLIARARDRLNGRLAVVSGRSIAEVDRILDGAAPFVAGIHGLERRSSSTNLRLRESHPALPDVTEAFKAIARAGPGLLVERKPMSVALHYRNAPSAADAVRELGQRLAAQHGLVIQEGVMVVELMTPGSDKGEAVEAFMAEATFRGAVPIFVGDDLTDEAGFAAATALGGLGVIVGARTPTAAYGRLRSPADVMGWIEESLAEGAFTVEADL